MPHEHVDNTTRRPLPRIYRWCRRETAVTARMLADNVLASSAPPLVFTLASALRFGSSVEESIRAVAVSLVWSTLFLYVFDSCNQAVGAAEDARNKPYRPVPAGLVSVAGMRRRAMAGSVLFLAVSAGISWVTFFSAAAWIAAVVSLYVVCPVRYAHLYKPLPMFVGTLAQLAGSWAIVQPLDGAVWWWVLVVSALFPIALPIEDVRDTAGDLACGRRTLALRWGPERVRGLFVGLMVLWPCIVHVLLFSRSGADWSAVRTMTGMFAALCWVTAVQTARDRSRRGSRRAFTLYSGVHFALVASSLVLLA